MCPDGVLQLILGFSAITWPARQNGSNASITENEITNVHVPGIAFIYVHDDVLRPAHKNALLRMILQAHGPQVKAQWGITTRQD